MLAERFQEVRLKMSQACSRANRDINKVNLIAVSKGQTLASIESLYALGQRDFGENYIQELEEKREGLRRLPGIRWHFIGHLQSNKSEKLVRNADFFHALDSVELAEKIKKSLLKIGVQAPYPVLVQVNFDGEKTKTGVSPTHIADLLKWLEGNKRIFSCLGFMCIPRLRRDPDEQRRFYKDFSRWADNLKLSPSPLLSMGMTDDFEVAIEEGAHWIRVGRALFGERKS